MTDPNQPGYPPQDARDSSGAPGPSQSGAPGRPTHGDDPKLRFSVGQVLGAILFVLLIIFIIENSNPVPMRIIAGPHVHPPLWVAIVIAAVVGALITELLRYRRHVGAKRKAELREHRAEGR